MICDLGWPPTGGYRMAFKDGSKAESFNLWQEGKSLEQIQKLVTAKPETVSGWIRDWERGSQGTWEPNIKNSN